MSGNATQHKIIVFIYKSDLKISGINSIEIRVSSCDKSKSPSLSKQYNSILYMNKEGEIITHEILDEDSLKKKMKTFRTPEKAFTYAKNTLVDMVPQIGWSSVRWKKSVELYNKYLAFDMDEQQFRENLNNGKRMNPVSSLYANSELELGETFCQNRSYFKVVSIIEDEEHTTMFNESIILVKVLDNTF